MRSSSRKTVGIDRQSIHHTWWFWTLICQRPSWLWGAHSEKNKSSLDSEYTSINCQFRQSFRSVIRWFNSRKNSNLLPSLKESLFGLSEHSPSNSCLKAKLNYTLLFMRFYIYSCKIRSKALHLLSDFGNQIEIQYQKKILYLINSYFLKNIIIIKLIWFLKLLLKKFSLLYSQAIK